MLVIALVFAAPASTETSEQEVKALFLYNLAKYVTWPADAFANDEAPIVVGIVGDDAFATQLTETIGEHRAQGRPVRVLRLSPDMPARGVHIVYLPESDYTDLRQQAQLFEREPAIRVAENKRFASVGDVGFVMNSGRVEFYVNEQNSRRGGLRVSSKLMRLASGVE